MTLAGFPHSGIPGSTPTCGSPRLFAACRALLRLSVPRHPPCALVRLTGYSPRRSLAAQAIPAHRSCSDHAWCSRVSLSTPRYYPTSHYPCFQVNTGWERVLDQALDLRALLSAPEGLTRGSRKEVIQPQVPLRLPCYDFAPVTELAFGGSLPCGLGHRLRALPTPMA